MIVALVIIIQCCRGGFVPAAIVWVGDEKCPSSHFDSNSPDRLKCWFLIFFRSLRRLCGVGLIWECFGLLCGVSGLRTREKVQKQN
ncbi:uncharacterized protein BDW43DRAFT_259184, partial [Aspergillus alliaceus]|uniref:uncharacterized protein n=1 Tax=Petromyces alliaceus TaxID=209559 RepID=UPI0012A4CA44